ncbi:MAG: YncE family protein [Muribaculaceae bacterium]
MRNLIILFLMLLSVALNSCREDIVIVASQGSKVTEPRDTGIAGFYLLNEGNMGSNKCTLDYFDEKTGFYNSNIYAERNPSSVKELGDVGNDIQIFGSKLYAVINCSHKVDVMNAKDATKIGQIDIPNCRYIRGYKKWVYVSSYVGGTQLDPKAPKGMVYKVDTLSLKIVGQVEVGYQPEEMTIVDNCLYVANSGGYRAPNYDNTITVINLDTFMKVNTIMVADNLHRMVADKYGRLWVSNRSDSYGNKSGLHIIDTKTMQVTKSFSIPTDNMTIQGDSIYIFGAEKNRTGKNVIKYTIINVKNSEIVNDNFITDGTNTKIKVPYGIAVHRVTKEIYITDAKNYVVSGTLYCFDKNGSLKWSHVVGNIPAHFAFN